MPPLGASSFVPPPTSAPLLHGQHCRQHGGKHGPVPFQWCCSVEAAHHQSGVGGSSCPGRRRSLSPPPLVWLLWLLCPPLWCGCSFRTTSLDLCSTFFPRFGCHDVGCGRLCSSTGISTSSPVGSPSSRSSRSTRSVRSAPGMRFSPASQASARGPSPVEVTALPSRLLQVPSQVPRWLWQVVLLLSQGFRRH